MFQEGSGTQTTDLITSIATAAFSVGLTWQTGGWGPCVRTDTYGRTWAMVSNSSTVLPTGAMTWILAWHKMDGTFRSAIVYAVMDTPSHECRTRVPYNDGTVYWEYGGTTEGVTRLTIGGLSFGEDLWIFSTGARGMEIWQNGTKRASNAANPTRTASTQSWQFGGTTGADVAEVAFLYTYNRQLSEADIGSIFAEPFQWFVQPATLPTPFRHGHGMVGVIHR